MKAENPYENDERCCSYEVYFDKHTRAVEGILMDETRTAEDRINAVTKIEDEVVEDLERLIGNKEFSGFLAEKIRDAIERHRVGGPGTHVNTKLKDPEGNRRTAMLVCWESEMLTEVHILLHRPSASFMDSWPASQVRCMRCFGICNGPNCPTCGP